MARSLNIPLSDGFQKERTMRLMNDLLLNHPALEGMDPKMISEMSNHATIRKFNAGDYIFRQGEKASHVYLLESGKVELELFSAPGGPLVVQSVEAGQVLGWSWLIAPYDWCFDARVVEATEAIELDATYLRELIDKDHHVGYEIMKRFVKVIAERLYAERLQLVNAFATQC
jgi:CRP-like cAMP-binding protein